MKGHSNPIMALTEHLDYDWVKIIIIITTIINIITTTIIITIIVIIITTIITTIIIITIIIYIMIITVSPRLLFDLSVGMLRLQGWHVQGVECEHS